MGGLGNPSVPMVIKASLISDLLQNIVNQTDVSFPHVIGVIELYFLFVATCIR